MPSCPVVNPGNAELGLPENDEPEAMELEMAMEELMDSMDGIPHRWAKLPMMSSRLLSDDISNFVSFACELLFAAMITE